MKISSLFKISGKVALVTGGGKGIGKMIAQGLVENGVKVYITSRSREDCEKTAEILTELGPGSCHSLPGDLSTAAGCNQVVEDLKLKEELLHILVNNSGTTWGQPIEKFSEKGFDKVMALNVKAPFFMTKALLPLLDKGAVRGDPARIINIGSIVGVQPQPFPTYPYDASKAAVHNLTKKLAYDLAKRADGRSITVNAIAPGYVPSNMSSQLTTYLSKETLESSIPLSRLGAAEDMAGAAIYLSSPAAAWVTGQVLAVDGGALSQPVGMKHDDH